ncbi:UPF0016-domain-containing protein [Aureobasidium sp. EXF-10727]|nr:UPF0016-domain-containing protein [Aureobasidium sp. EXF-10727]
MRVRSSPSTLLLLLLPAIVSSAAVEPKAQDGVLVAKAPVAGAVKDYTAITTSNARAPTQKPVVGTKDAPVDGLDGKPHAGPFVDITPEDKKKPAAVAEDLVKPLPTSLSKLKGSDATDFDSIPEKNDGVMDDVNRVAPKEGTTGTEGGVTERNKKEKAAQGQTGEKVEKKPETPKEAPPLPHSEQERISKDSPEKAKEAINPVGKPKGAQGLEKPVDLPEKPHEIPAPAPKKATELESEKKDTFAHVAPVDTGSSGTLSHTVGSTLKDTLPYTEGKQPAPALGDGTEGIIQPFHSFVLAFTMIIFSEIGDKTFLVAALMAMRHPQLVVFSGAFSALIAMTVLSAVLGHAVPTLLPKHLTAWLAAGLFLIFGGKLLREGLEMDKDAGVGEEMQEVEAELEEKEHLARKEGRRRSSVSPYVLEAGRGRRSGSRHKFPARAQSPSSDSSRSPSPSGRGAKASVSNALGGLNNLLGLLLSPAWVQTFVMTFLGEWGDRSQIATIAMAAGQDYWWVTGGAIAGHMICTGIAVIGGRALAGRVSLRVVTLGGAIAFLVFGVIYFFEALYD